MLFCRNEVNFIKPIRVIDALYNTLRTTWNRD